MKTSDELLQELTDDEWRVMNIHGYDGRAPTPNSIGDLADYCRANPGCTLAAQMMATNLTALAKVLCRRQRQGVPKVA
jgi:hypothetical protein